jgi:hypothetical protein
MAVSNLTYVRICDKQASAPEKESTPVAFSNYNEAMSFAKYAAWFNTLESVRVYVWNYNGGSGHWDLDLWTATGNKNWPE